MRYAARTDTNKKQITEALDKLGVKWWDLKQPTDLLVYINWGGVKQNVFVEIKDGSKPPSAQKHTQQQVKFFAEWPGPKVTVRSVDDVISLISHPTVRQ